MKHELTLIFVSVLVVLGAAFFFYTNSGFTGYVVYNESSSVDVTPLNISESQANVSIAEAEGVIVIMESNNFTHKHMDDELIEAEKVFQQARYVEIIRNSNDDKKIAEAKRALQLINWQSITFNDVIPHTEDIKQRKIEAFEIYDSISILRKDIRSNLDNGFDVTSATNLADSAERAFYQERYNDSRGFIVESRNSLEGSVSGTSTLSGIQNGAKNFIQKYWMQIIIFIIVFAWVSSIITKQIGKNRLEEQIKAIKRERESLTGLMKKTQSERYRENKISEWVYGIRIKHYKERMNVINEKLPVMQARLRELKGEEDKH
jgi:hypothetical protein